ncbi:relaxase/mobilization nuclease domain-containing protein [Streptomyces luteireticuli]
MAKLVRYLWGPGRANEHTDPHAVAISNGCLSEGFPAFADASELAQLAADLDAPQRIFGTEVREGHVWHCSVSIPPEDGELGDEAWAKVARRVVDEMGFSGTADRAPCRWVAVHHGKSTRGNDHIHLVVNVVREDGSKADVFRDYHRSQQLCGRLEQEMGLRVVEGRMGRGMPGIKRGEREAAARRGRPEPARLTLARRVRAAAAGSQSETEFVAHLRRSGVLVRPRYQAGGQSVVTGYSVALREKNGESPVWYGGGKLAADLTLTKLRAQWPGSEPADAVEAWKSGAVVREPNSVRLRDESAWEMAAQQIAAVRERLTNVPMDDVTQWAQVARETAGLFAAWSQRLEGDRPGALAQAADALARSAQLPDGVQHRPDTASKHTDLRGVALVVMYSRSGEASDWGEYLMLRTLRNTLRAIHDMHRAREEHYAARQIEDSARHGLAELERARQTLMDSPGAPLPPPGPQLDPYGRPDPGPSLDR